MRRLSILLSLIFTEWVAVVIYAHGHSKSRSLFPQFFDPRSKRPSMRLNATDLQYHGTTTIAFKFADSVFICVDSKASIGTYVGSRTVKKVFPIAPKTVATMAGGAADCALWIRRVAAMVRSHEYRYKTRLSVRAIAVMFAQQLRSQRDSGLSIGTMVAGWRPDTGPNIHYIDSEGSCIEGNVFCVGSGSNLAYSIIDSSGILGAASIDNKLLAEVNRPSISANSGDSGSNSGNSHGGGGSSGSDSRVETNSVDCGSCDNASHYSLHAKDREFAVSTAVRAVKHATLRDGFSGGYINVLEVNSSGIHHILRLNSNSAF